VTVVIPSIHRTYYEDSIYLGIIRWTASSHGPPVDDPRSIGRHRQFRGACGRPRLVV